MQFYLTKIALDKYGVCFCRVKQNLDWSMKENGMDMQFNTICFSFIPFFLTKMQRMSIKSHVFLIGLNKIKPYCLFNSIFRVSVVETNLLRCIN